MLGRMEARFGSVRLGYRFRADAGLIACRRAPVTRRCIILPAEYEALLAPGPFLASLSLSTQKHTPKDARSHTRPVPCHA